MSKTTTGLDWNKKILGLKSGTQNTNYRIEIKIPTIEIKKEKQIKQKHTVRPRRRRGSSTCEKLGTLAVLRISG